MTNENYNFLFCCCSGGVKLLSLGAGHTDLNVVISETNDVKASAKAFMTAQTSGEFNLSDIGKLLYLFVSL